MILDFILKLRRHYVFSFCLHIKMPQKTSAGESVEIEKLAFKKKIFFSAIAEDI
jgi:hypothetical protein